MSKQYKLKCESYNDVDQATIEVTETKEVVTIKRISIGQIKQEIANIDSQIDLLEARRDTLIDELSEVKSNTELSVKNIPNKKERVDCSILTLAK